MSDFNDPSAIRERFITAGFTAEETEQRMAARINLHTSKWLRDQGITDLGDPDVIEFRALSNGKRGEVLASGKTLREWFAPPAPAPSKPEPLPSEPKPLTPRQVTLAAKREAAAELDRQIAIAAGYPETSAFLAGVKPGVLKNLKQFGIGGQPLIKMGGTQAIIVPRGSAVGDQNWVDRKDGRDGFVVIIGLTPLSARDGELWDLAAVEDLTRHRRAVEAKAAEQAAAEKAKAARVSAATAAEAARRATVAMSEAIAKAEAERIAGLDDDAVRAEVHRLAMERIHSDLGADAAAETVDAITRDLDTVISTAEMSPLRLAAADLATGARMGVARRPRPLAAPLGLADCIADARHQIAEGFELVVVVRGKRKEVTARWISIGGEWKILAQDPVGALVTVTHYSSGAGDRIKPKQAFTIGGGLALITAWAKA